MNEDRHVDVDTLAALILGALDGAEVRRVEEHLTSGCAQCRRSREWAERIIALGRSDRSLEPPPHILARAMRIFQVEQGDALEGSSPWHRLRALPLSDSRELTGAIGARGATAATRQVLYGVLELDVEIDVQVHRRPDAGRHLQVHGQVFSADGSSVAGLSVHLPEPDGIEEARTTSQGEFQVEVPEAAEYLLLRMQGTDIEIPVPTP